jgi:23S rRNA pseudouridine1911/1915/1917 synthase
MTERLSATVEEDEAGVRVDRFLASRWIDLSRARIIALITEGAITMEMDDGRRVVPSMKVRIGDTFAGTPPPPIQAEPLPEAMPLSITYEDDDLIVIDKAAGLTVHPAPGHWSGTLVNGLLHHCGDSLSGIGGVKRPGIVHRIDKDTSGLMVAAKNDIAHHGLASQFEAHSVERAYLAYVWGVPGATRGRIEGGIARDPKNRKRMAMRAYGKAAVTHYRVLRAFGVGASEIECRLETGRTHQIRVHMSEMTWPLIGDPTYGRVSRARKAALTPTALEAALGIRRQALHAATLGFIHPVSGEHLIFESSPPPDLQALAGKLTEMQA